MASSFEWDEQKEASNLEKHGVRFEQATDAFTDAFAIELPDRRKDYGEQRTILIGLAAGSVLTVVYTERGGNIRIISARRASRHEREAYYRQQRGQADDR